MNIKLYSTNCPKCFVLEQKLKAEDIAYELITDADLMIEKGFTSAPMLEVDGTVMDFKGAIDWINKRTGQK